MAAALAGDSGALKRSVKLQMNAGLCRARHLHVCEAAVGFVQG
jgi:hypothetical protein